jgi:hypothetical protein
VRATAWFKRLVAVLTILFPGPGLVTLGVVYSVSHDKAVLRDDGVPVAAQVTDLHVEHGKNKSVQYRVGYQFQASPRTGDPPQTYQGDGGVGGYRYDHLRIGDAVPVLYEPGRPSNSGLNFDDTLHKSDPYEMMPPTVAIVVVAFGGVYALMMSFVLVSYFREKNPLQWGSAAPAVIIKEEQVRGRRPSMTATYQFTDAQGRLVTGLQKGLPSAKKLDWPGFREFLKKVTDNPVALYDPADSDKSMLYRAGFLVCSQP